MVQHNQTTEKVSGIKFKYNARSNLEINIGKLGITKIWPTFPHLSVDHHFYVYGQNIASFKTQLDSFNGSTQQNKTTENNFAPV